MKSLIIIKMINPHSMRIFLYEKAITDVVIAHPFSGILNNRGVNLNL